MSQRVAAAFVTLLVLACSSAPPPRRAEIPTYSAGSEDDPDARRNWYWEQRTYPTGTIPVDVHLAEVRRELETKSAFADDATWTSLGPAPLRDIPFSYDTVRNASGRILTIALHPTDANTILLGTAMGGIWKSVDGGQNFHSTGPEQSLPSLSVGVIKYNPTNPSILFAGTGEAHGSTSMYGNGLLRSGDGGETWAPLPMRGDGWNFEYAAITGLQFDARDANTLYITTATITPSVFRTPPHLPATGFFKSTDGGMTWRLLHEATNYGAPTNSVGFMDLEYGGALAPDVFYVSEYYGGILRSKDGGATFDYITPRKSGGFGKFPQVPGELAFYDSRGLHYVKLKRFENAETAIEFRRVEIALAASNPNVLFAGYDAALNRLDLNDNGVLESSDPSAPMSLLFKSEDGGDTWRWLGTVFEGIPDYCARQCYFDNVVTINPQNENDIVLGGMANYIDYQPFPLTNPVKFTDMPWRGMVYRSLDGGKTWIDTTPHCTAYSRNPFWMQLNRPVYGCVETDVTKVIHPDVHAIAFGKEHAIYAGTDGGLYRAVPPAPTPRGKQRAVRKGPPGSELDYRWENVNNGLSTLQFYRVATHPTDPNIILGGMQDNSCGYWNGSVWEGWGGGDGTIAAFDPSDPKIVYIGSQFAVHRHMNGGAKEFSTAAGWKYGIWSPDKVARGESTSFVVVFAIDRMQPNVVYGASTRALYRSTNRGDTFTRLPGDTEGVPTWISVSEVNPNRVWVSTSTGAVYRYDIDGDTATQKTVSPGLPIRYATRVMAGIDSADTVYAVFSGYGANTPGNPGKVFLSTDAGATWKDITGNLPDVPASAIALDPFDVNRLWVAQDTAVYSTRDRGTTWTSERRNMPVVGVLDLEYNRNTGYLTAATHGRGVWRMRVGGGAGQ